MPTKWVDNDEFMSHMGPQGEVVVFHVAKNDDAEEGWRSYWFGLTPYASDQVAGTLPKILPDASFDIRELPGGSEAVPWSEEQKTVLRNAIEAGLLLPPDEEEVPKVGDTIEDDDGWTYTITKVDPDGNLVRANQNSDEPQISFIFDLHELRLAGDGHTWLGRLA